MSEHTSEPDDILLLTAPRGGGGRTVNQWDQNGPKEPVDQLCVSTEYSGDGGLAVVDKEHFIRVRKSWTVPWYCRRPNLIGGVVGAGTIVVLIANGNKFESIVNMLNKYHSASAGGQPFAGGIVDAH